jgi:hypothetical protein
MSTQTELINLVFNGLKEGESIGITNTIAKIFIPNIDELLKTTIQDYLNLGYKNPWIEDFWAIKKSNMSDHILFTRRMKFTSTDGERYTERAIISMDEHFHFIQSTADSTIE